MKVRDPRPRWGGMSLSPVRPRLPLCEVGQHGGIVAESGACEVSREKWPWWEEESGGQALLCSVAGGEAMVVYFMDRL